MIMVVLFSAKHLTCKFSWIMQEVALLTDGRFSGGSHGYVVGHICPEAQVHYVFCFTVFGKYIMMARELELEKFASRAALDSRTNS
jgi:hypothetical protein